MFKWYAINTYSGREDSVRAELSRRISLSASARFFKEINVPKYTELKKLKGGKTKEVEKITMPGYLLVHMDVKDKDAESLVRNTQGVIGFVGVEGKPTALSPKDIDNIMGKTKTLDSKKKSTEVFAIGDLVEFVDGPFLSMQAYVEESDNDKIKVSLEGMFSRTIEMDVEADQIRKSSKQ